MYSPWLQILSTYGRYYFIYNLTHPSTSLSPFLFRKVAAMFYRHLKKLLPLL